MSAFRIDPGLLLTENTLAVELHQIQIRRGFDIDASFDFQLSAVLIGDFNGNGMLDADDLDRLSTEVKATMLHYQGTN